MRKGARSPLSQTQWRTVIRNTKFNIAQITQAVNDEPGSQEAIGVQPKSFQDCACNVQGYKNTIQCHIQGTKNIFQQEAPSAFQLASQTITLLLLLINTLLAALIIFLSYCFPDFTDAQAPIAMSFPSNQQPPRRMEGLTSPLQEGGGTQARLQAEDPLGSEPAVTPAPSEAETLSAPDFREILKAIAQGVNAMARDNQRSYVNERAPFADTPLLFNGENVTLFIKEIERRSSFYQWTIEDRISRLLGHCDHTRRDIIENSMTEFEAARSAKDWQGIRTALRKRFRSLDQAQREETEDSLRSWCLSCSMTTNLSLQSYLDAFGPRFNRCLEAGSVTAEQKGFFLARGLNRERLNKVLNKFDLSIARPSDFAFERIELFLSKMASRESEIEAFNPALGKNSSVAKPTTGDSLGPIPANTFRAPQLDPNVISPSSFVQPKTNQRPQGEQGSQMPPGHEPTQNEVDDLIEKFTRIKLSGMNLSISPQEPREAELLSYADVQEAIGLALAKISVPHAQAQNQTQGNQNFPQPPRTAPSVPSYQQSRAGFQQNPQAQNYGNQQGPRVCYTCGKMGHVARFCETRDELIRNQWIHLNPQGRISWGTEEQPEGEVRNVPGTHIMETIIEGIKTQLKQSGKPVIDPVTTMNPYVKRTQGQMGLSNNTIIMEQDGSQDSGVMEEDEFARCLKLAGMVIGAEEAPFTPATVACASLSNPAISDCDPKTAALKPVTSHTPMVRNNKSRDADWIRPKAVSFDEDMDIDDDERKSQETESKTAPRKHRVLESLPANPDQMVHQVLNTAVSVQLKDLLAIAPELQKRLGKAYYTSEHLETLLRPKPARQSPIGPSLQNNSVNVSNMAITCPEYVEVEASGGLITRAGSRSNNSRLAVPQFPRAYHYQNSFLAPSNDDDQPRTTSERREYDKDHGFEHVRRDCPRAPMMIHEVRLSALLDSGAELNTMRLKTAQAAGLVVTSMPQEMGNSRMQAANGSFESFAGMVWRAPVSIGNIVISTNFFVLRTLSNPVILGNPYLADAQTTFEYGADGRMKCTVFSEDRSAHATFIGATDNTFGTIARTSVQPKASGV
jgi:hypothetical protein